MVVRHKDFDAARAEQNLVPVTFQIGGVLFEAPPALPASVVLDIIRMKEENLDPSSLVKRETFTEMLGKLLGAEQMEHLMQIASLKELPEILGYIVSTYTGDYDPNTMTPAPEATLGV